MQTYQLKTRRDKLGISQIAFAKKAGVSRFVIQMFESGYRDLTPEEKIKIRTALSMLEMKNAKNKKI